MTWLTYRSVGPYLLERSDSDEPTVIDDLHPALCEFWASIGAPAWRRLWDSTGKVIAAEITGAGWEIRFTAEVERWVKRQLGDEVYEALCVVRPCSREVAT